MLQLMSDKSHIHVHETIIDLSIISFLEEAKHKNQLDRYIQSEYLFYYFAVALVQFGFIICMVVAIINDHQDFQLYASQHYTLLLVKFFASCALHLMLYPEVSRSMELMKYILNHYEKFTNPNAAISIAFTAHHINIMAEMLNMYILLYQHTVEHCIIHFVALEIIVEIPHYYITALINDKLKDELFKDFKHLTVYNRAAEIPWNTRSRPNQFGRICYKFHRALYVCIIFYFQPFIVIFLYRYTVDNGNFPKH